MPRKKSFQIFREAGKVGPYAEKPMLPDDIQVQLHLSRNDRPQPFYSIYDNDTLLVLMSGTSVVTFKSVSVHEFSLKPGDNVYVPAGTPHRILPAEEAVIMRYRAREAGWEGVVWYCEQCDRELHRQEWNTGEALSQDRFADVTAAFNGDKALRTCRQCGWVHPILDLAPFQWREVAEEARAG